MKKLAIAIIQARMSSSRLPGKVMMPLAGQPMIWHIVQRARDCSLVDQVIVATSTETSDDTLADFCEAADIPYKRGSLKNVLSRFINILHDDPHRYVVRITGDCPLIYPEFIDKQIIALAAHDGDSVRCRETSTVLAGQGVHSARSLKEVFKLSSHPDDLEHVGSRYLAENPGKFRIIGMELPRIFINSKWRFTVDEKLDFEMMEALYNDLWEGDTIDLKVAIKWCLQNPSISMRNASVNESPINQEITKAVSESGSHVCAIFDWENASKSI